MVKRAGLDPSYMKFKVILYSWLKQVSHRSSCTWTVFAALGRDGRRKRRKTGWNEGNREEGRKRGRMEATNWGKQREEERGGREREEGVGDKEEASYLFRYGLFTPAIFGVSHLMYRTHALMSPNTATIKHILAELVRFSFRRLLIYAPARKDYLAVSSLSPALAQ